MKEAVQTNSDEEEDGSRKLKPRERKMTVGRRLKLEVF